MLASAAVSLLAARCAGVVSDDGQTVAGRRRAGLLVEA